MRYLALAYHQCELAHHSTSLRLSFLAGKIKMSHLAYFSNCHVVKVLYSSSTPWCLLVFVYLFFCFLWRYKDRYNSLSALEEHTMGRCDVNQNLRLSHKMLLWGESLRYKYELVKKIEEAKTRAAVTEGTALCKDKELRECTRLGPVSNSVAWNRR